MKSFEKIGTIKIYGDDWEYGWGNCGVSKGKKAIGKCYYEQKRICISKNYYKHCPLSDVLAHEIFHAYIPIAQEQWVEEFGFAVGEAERNLNNSLTA